MRSEVTASFEDLVAQVLRSLQPGEVVSYGEVAAEAGSPGAARAVGNLLRRGLPDAPWWRVVRADGAICCPNGAEQIRRLLAERVEIRTEGDSGGSGRVVGFARARRPDRATR